MGKCLHYDYDVYWGWVVNKRLSEHRTRYNNISEDDQGLLREARILISRNTALRGSRGLSLVELAIAVAVLAMIGAFIGVTLASHFFYYNTITAPASYTIYVEEEGVEKNIGTIDLGDVSIRYPKRIFIGDSDEVSLSLIPLDGGIPESDVIGESTDEGTYYVVSEKVDLYSVMRAELKAASFTISSDSTQDKEVSLTSRTDWVWVVTPNPNTIGEQLLIAELSTPVRVEGYEGLASRAVYSQSIHISVREPFNWRILLDYWYIVAGIIGGTVGAVFGLRRLWKLMKRKKTQNTKE